MDTQQSLAVQRVERFIADYAAQWKRAEPLFKNHSPFNSEFASNSASRSSTPDAFDEWARLTRPLVREHWTTHSTMQLGNSFGDAEPYGKQVLSCSVQDDVATVVTKIESPPTRCKEFTLLREGDDWKIDRTATYFGDPGAPFLSSVEVAERIEPCSTDAPFEPLPPHETGLNQRRNFKPRWFRHPLYHLPSRAKVRAAGTFKTTSGVIAAMDFGYDNDDEHPLTRRVQPGEYPVHRVIAAGRNAAIRVRFSAEQPVRWYPASIPLGGHIMGIDTGAGCIVDYVSYLQMTRREKARQHTEFCNLKSPAIREFPMGEAAQGIAFETGFGDGGYPVYWGVDVNGSVVELVVDFMLLVKESADGKLTHQ